MGAHDARYGHERSALIYTHTSARHVPFHAVAIPPRARRPDEKLIAAHWADVLRVTCSVRTGVVSPSLMLKRLSAYPRQNRLALALREVERIERTLRTLDWIELPLLRRQTTAELNKGESRHALARAVAFHRLGRLGRLRDCTAAMLQHRANALALVTGAMTVWNTVYLGRALDAMRARGEAIPDALLVHLAPSAGSTSTSPAIISGALTKTLARTGSGCCGTWQHRRGRPPHDVQALSRKRESSTRFMAHPQYEAWPRAVGHDRGGSSLGRD